MHGCVGVGKTRVWGEYVSECGANVSKGCAGRCRSVCECVRVNT